MSSKERAKLRLDATQRSARVADVPPGSATSRRPNAVIGDVVDGSKNPELFFRVELFRHLVASSFVTLPQVYPKVVRARSSDLFHDAAEWQYFQSVTTEFARLLQVEKELRRNAVAATARPVTVQQLAALRLEQCAAMAAAMRTLRERFGRERFDRMLYEVVPRSLSITVAAPDGSGMSKAIGKYVQQLVEEEDKCQ